MSSSRPLSPSRVAAPVAHGILESFVAHREDFRAITRQARLAFEAQDWTRLRAGSAQRLELVRDAVTQAEMKVRVLLGERCRDRLVWVSAKAVYSALIAARQDWDLAETFFNGVTRRIFDTVGVDPFIEFVASDFDAPPVEPAERAYSRITEPAGLSGRIERLLRECELEAPFADRAGAAAAAAARIEQGLRERGEPGPIAIEALRPLFYRGHAAYLVGRLVLPAGVVRPLVLAIHHGARGLFVDAVLLSEDDVSMLFSYTRTYFQVDAPRPYDVMRFLRSLIPKKRIAEIYIALGEPKQGKTELYRAVTDHLAETSDVFGFAPGVPGLVMVVFTMPGMDVVVKVIRDHFAPEKQVTRARVKERYRWVYKHDRAGRLVDAQQFEHLVFDRARFAPELLEELLGQCGNAVALEGDRVVVDLAYLERQLVPLNLYIRQRSQAEAERALVEWGRAIEDLAAENIFPGDLLLKNFGVTRQSRVALYDYDELEELTSMNFRLLPEPADDEDAMRAEPFFAVGSRDVFPEEFPRFLGVPGRLKEVLHRECKHVFDPAWWREMQARVERGVYPELSPYPQTRRLTP